MSKRSLLSRSRSVFKARLPGPAPGQPDRLWGSVAVLQGRPTLFLLADDPTAALDQESGLDGVDLFRRLADDTQAAIVMVTHDNKILDSADRIVHLDDGGLVAGS